MPALAGDLSVDKYHQEGGVVRLLRDLFRLGLDEDSLRIAELLVVGAGPARSRPREGEAGQGAAGGRGALGAAAR
jgi:hypothetical protein